MPAPVPPRLEIDYWSEGFAAGALVNNGIGVLTTNWNELLWAAVTVGRPSRHYVFRYGRASAYEAVFRLSLMRMALEQRSRAARRLRRTEAFKTLDPSEKGAVSYFLGMTFCKLFSARLLDAPWALHLDVFGSDLNPVLRGRSRPDLIAEINSSGWVALESKGRISTPTGEDKNKAKDQAKRVVSVSGVSPQFHIGAITYFRGDTLQFFWRDPEPGHRQPSNPIKVAVSDDDWRHYYQPVFDLVRSLPDFPTKMTVEPHLVGISGLDIRIGIHMEVLSHLSESQWSKAKHFCQEHRQELRDAGYQDDGIRIVAGSSWFQPFEKLQH